MINVYRFFNPGAVRALLDISGCGNFDFIFVSPSNAIVSTKASCKSSPLVAINITSAGNHSFSLILTISPTLTFFHFVDISFKLYLRMASALVNSKFSEEESESSKSDREEFADKLGKPAAELETRPGTTDIVSVKMVLMEWVSKLLNSSSSLITVVSLLFSSLS